jgi:hypothetical protein
MSGGEARAVRRLVVQLKTGPGRTQSVDYYDAALLERQLADFAQRRTNVVRRRPEDLHTFSNECGETLAFGDDDYVDHEIVDLRVEPDTSAGVYR